MVFLACSLLLSWAFWLVSMPALIWKSSEVAGAGGGGAGTSAGGLLTEDSGPALSCPPSRPGACFMTNLPTGLGPVLFLLPEDEAVDARFWEDWRMGVLWAGGREAEGVRLAGLDDPPPEAVLVTVVLVTVSVTTVSASSIASALVTEELRLVEEDLAVGGVDSLLLVEEDLEEDA